MCDAAFEEAGLPTLGYFSDPEERVEVQLRVDPETGELLDVEFTEVDADVVDAGFTVVAPGTRTALARWA